jgi:hypothetical protein
MDEEAVHLLKRVILVAVIVLLVTLAIYFPRYQHPMPEKDCSQPYDYPMCRRAVDPLPNPPASTLAVIMSVAIMLVLAVVLVIAAYRASVVEQTAIVTAMASAKEEKPKEKEVVK